MCIELLIFGSLLLSILHKLCAKGYITPVCLIKALSQVIAEGYEWFVRHEIRRLFIVHRHFIGS